MALLHVAQWRRQVDLGRLGHGLDLAKQLI